MTLLKHTSNCLFNFFLPICCIIFHLEICQKCISGNTCVYTTSDELRSILSIFVSLQIATATGSRVIAVDNFASNGVIHVIDRVMFPLPVGTLPEVSSTFPQLSTLVRLVDSAELREAFSGKTRLFFFNFKTVSVPVIES